MTNLALVTTEILPMFQIPCAGGGVRVWGIGEMLRQAGVDCTYWLPENAVAGLSLPENVPIQVFKPELLHERLSQAGCDAVLFEQWQPLSFLQEPLDCPVFVDLPGPLIMEYYWRDPKNYYQHIVDKVECLAKADYFLCALDRQRGYYQSWLLLAGVSPAETRLGVLPFCFPEMPFSRGGHVEDEPLFFWGGMFWPWQERREAFEAMADALNRLRRGQLVVAGGGRQKQDLQEWFRAYLDHPHVSWLGNLPFSEFVCELKRAAVAVDICKPTAERALSSDLRTGMALWAGAPCLVTKDSPWACLIEEQNAGWAIDSCDEEDLRKLTKEIALERVDIVGKRRGAKVISQQISADIKRAEIMEWLRNPTKREKHPAFFAARGEDREQRLRSMQKEIDLLRFERDALGHDLAAIRNKPLFRVYKSVMKMLGRE